MKKDFYSRHDIEVLIKEIGNTANEEWFYVGVLDENNDTHKDYKKRQSYVAKGFWGQICSWPIKESPQYCIADKRMKEIATLPDACRIIKQLLLEIDQLKGTTNEKSN